MEARKKIFVGMSGGVDSSVSAYLLKKAGHDVTGVFIKVWQPPFFPCTATEDRLDAMRVCAILDIPFKTLDLEDEYKKHVVDYMLKEYAAGRTPNPDVMCNKHIKFGAFLKWAKENGADAIATGHYAQNILNQKTGEYELHKGIDPAKDQSYFLWTIQRAELPYVLFPVGGFYKSEVRAIADRAGLPTYNKKDSQGLCFIGTVDMKDFLKHFIRENPGELLSVDGEVIGTHIGTAFYTLGERHGFTILKKSSNDTPYYIVAKDMTRNTITVSHQKADSYAVSEPVLEEENLLGGVSIDSRVEAQIRYHGSYHKGKVSSVSPLRLSFDEKIAISPGQSVVIYAGERCLGGATVV